MSTLNLKRIEPQRTHLMVAGSIETEILSGRVAPGDPLPSEEGLALQLGVNRSTVREALRVLEQSGLVRREPGRKRLLASIPRPAEIGKPFQAAMILHQVTFEELWETMHALEPATAVAAAKRRDENVLAALDDNLEATRRALSDSSSLAALDIEFHNLIAQAGGNRAIQLARKPLGEFFYPAFYAVIERLHAGERLLAAHEHIVDALRARDAATAHEWMERHMVDFRRGFELGNLDIKQPIRGMPSSGRAPDLRPTVRPKLVHSAAAPAPAVAKPATKAKAAVRPAVPKKGASPRR